MSLKILSMHLLNRSNHIIHHKTCLSTSCWFMKPNKVSLKHNKEEQTLEEDSGSAKLTNAMFAKYLKSNKCLQNAIDNKTIKSVYVRLLRSQPSALFCVSKSTAKSIAKSLAPFIKENTPLIEVNPGVCFLSRELLKSYKNNLHLYDISTLQESTLQQLEKDFPGRVKYYNTDFFSMWKFAFLDKMDKGNRVEKLLEGLTFKTDPSNNSGYFQVFGTIPSLDFIKHLINSVVFQNSIMSLSKPEFFITLLPKIYYSVLPITNENGENNVYRAMPVLFNVLFDMKFIETVPRKDFLPWHNEKPYKMKNSFTKLAKFDDNVLYLVHITLKKDLPCDVEHFPLLWHFLKHHLRNKTNRIIPMLEQWIPGSGIWLITNQDPPGTNPKTSPNEKNSPLPHMTIFTRFSDLTPEQNVTVFKKFISWPEFKHSPFEDSLENELMKVFGSGDINRDEVMAQDQDEEHENA